MKKLKVINWILISFLIVGCENPKLKRAEEKNNDYIEKITTLTERLTEITNENEELLEKLEQYEPEILEDGECIFTRTYRVIEKMNYQTTDNISKFVILDQFQDHQPFIVNLSKDQASKLTKNKNYEFMFTGNKKAQKSKYSELFKNFEITDIKETDRVGLDQLQEPCR